MGPRRESKFLHRLGEVTSAAKSQKQNTDGLLKDYAAIVDDYW